MYAASNDPLAAISLSRIEAPGLRERGSYLCPGKGCNLEKRWGCKKNMSMQMNQETLLQARWQLHEWGRWVKTPPEKRQTNPLAAKVDHLVAEMPDDLREMVIQKFSKHLPLYAIAASRGISRQIVAQRIDNAVGFVCGAMTGIE